MAFKQSQPVAISATGAAVDAEAVVLLETLDTLDTLTTVRIATGRFSRALGRSRSALSRLEIPIREKHEIVVA